MDASSEQVPMPAAAWQLLQEWNGVWDAPRFRSHTVVLQRDVVGYLLKLAASCAAVLQPHVDSSGANALPPHGASRQLLVAALDHMPAGSALANPAGDPEGFVRALAKSCFKNGDNDFVDHLPEAKIDALLKQHCAAALKQADMFKSDPGAALAAVLDTASAKVRALVASPPKLGDMEAIANRLHLADSLQRIADEADRLLSAPQLPTAGVGFAHPAPADDADEAGERPSLRRTKSQMAASVRVQKVKQHVDDTRSPLHALSRTVSKLAKHDVPDATELDSWRAELEAVDQARTRARNFGEDLMQDMLVLDGLSGLTPEDRSLRKASIAGIESMLTDVDAAKSRLGALHKTLQTKLEAAEAAQAKKAPAPAPPPAPAPGQGSMPFAPGSARVAAETAFPSREDWQRLRLPLRFHSMETLDSYQITATVPGIDTEELKLELSEDRKLVVRGLKVPTAEEAKQLQRKIAARIQQLVQQLIQQSPQQLTQSNLNHIAKEAYLEHGQDSFGRFEERFQMPADANVEGIDASYTDGVLRIMVPRRSQAPRSPQYGMGGFGGPGRFSGGVPRPGQGVGGGMPGFMPGGFSAYPGSPGGAPGGMRGGAHGGNPGLFGGLDNNYLWSPRR